MTTSPSAPLVAHPSGHATNTLGTLRRRGVQIWAVTGWVALGLILLGNVALGAGDSLGLLVIGVALNIGPTTMALHGRSDAEARALIGTQAAIIPAMMVFMLRGHPWQMDAHMYFFVAMAGLVVLADWRPLALATLLTVVHHTTFEWLAPQWVFAGIGNFDRVVFHVVAVGLQCIALTILAIRLEKLVNAQDEAVATSAALAQTAEAERSRAMAAMEQAHAAEAQAARERLTRQEVTAQAAAERRDEFVKLAETFERSVTSVVKAIGESTDRLEKSALRLDETVVGADQAAEEVASGASLASTEIMQVASSIHDLSQSVHTISATAGRQTELTEQASGEARDSVRTIALLEEQTTVIEGLIGDIREIASQTNLLALNATIEAARAGDAGRGFSVVASEVKSLAESSRRASDQMSQLLAGIREGVVETSTKLRSVNGAIAEVATAAEGIALAVGEQQTAAKSVGASTDRAVETSADIERRIAQVATAASVVTSLSTEVKSSVSMLASSTRELSASTDMFVSFLQKSGPLAA